MAKQQPIDCNECMPIATEDGSYAHYHGICRELRRLRAGCWDVKDEREICAQIAEMHLENEGSTNEFLRGVNETAQRIANAIRARSRG